MTQVPGKRFRRSLVVGKFCPLHRGHQFLIDTAIRDCPEVIVISYAKPGFAGYEPEKRRNWLSTLYPYIESLVVDDTWLSAWIAAHGPAPFSELPADDASEDIHREFCGWLCWHVLGKSVDAVFTSEDYGDGFAASLTRYFQTRDPMLPSVSHVSVDRARNTVPTSGTALRGDLFTHRAFLDQRVYASLVARVAFIGGESSGKSTLSRAMAEHLDTASVAEYGRELWEEQAGDLHYDDLLKIAREQVAREEQACLSTRRWLFCDTTPLTTLFYCLDMFGRAEAELERLSHRHYDRLFLCAPDFEFVQDGTRQDPAFRARQHEWYLRELERRKLPYHLLTGSVAERIESVSRVLGA